MNVSIQPLLDGLASERLQAFAVQLADPSLTDDAVRALAAREANWARRGNLLNGQTHAFEASARLLADLRLLKWRVRADNCGIELESPPHPRLLKRSPTAVSESKEAVRRELGSALAQQFADPLVRRFIRDLEEPSKGSRRKSITRLVADGRELLERLAPALRADGDARVAALSDAVQPYLQLVPGEGEPAILDEFTSISLNDIWRYFRYTWSIPQTAIPGRQMFYLIRDKAHSSHAVIGIAALGNSSLVSPLRDNDIGWTTDLFSARLLSAASRADRGELRHLLNYLEAQIADALNEIDPSGLATPEELSSPIEDIILRLQRRADEFAGRREDALREVAEAVAAGVSVVQQETEQMDYKRLPPVSTAVLELEGKRAPKDSPETLARRLLVAKKRAFELSRLLRARLTLARCRSNLANPTTATGVITSDDFRFAVGVAVTSAKSDKVGTSVLEITTCGAVAPYNLLLGGKLVALLLLSPEIADDYRRRYAGRASIISSQMKNSERTKDCTLAWLNTTSLYSLGSSQYERLVLPAGTIADDQPELRYRHIGDTEGYGTVQFSEATVLAVQAALEERNQFKGINSIFGEGFSPKFRKLRDGMVALGFNPTVLMRHDQTRRMYAVPMWDGAREFLRGESSDGPAYIRVPNRFRSATSRIVQYWRRRWLASRLNHEPTLQALRASQPWSLTKQVDHLPVADQSLKSRPRKKPVVSEQGVPQKTSSKESDAISFWRDLAHAGPESCADELDSDHLSRLHVSQPLDAFLVSSVRRGFSLVLTGNAGDGKTHLLRRLEPELRKLGAVVETDATAAMRPGDVSGILARWKKAHRDGKPFCLAANEYPMHLLREVGAGFAPIDEASRQCDGRLAYSDRADDGETAREKVLVVDLSLRNPLSRDFARALLEKLISVPELSNAGESNPESDIAWNLRHLGSDLVKQRLIDLLTRLAAAGHRATVREVWIWAARLVLGSGHEDRKPVHSPERWYSSRLFDIDDRFEISGLFRKLADPAACSHPRWDYRLESGRVVEGWLVERPASIVRMDVANFAALKRRFYFEHESGNDIFSLDGLPGEALLKVLVAQQAPESQFKQHLIGLINRAYCPQPFPQMSSSLYLWIGHRFQEQPSHGHVANQCISQRDLNLSRPRLPKRLEGAFEYQADHLLLEYRDHGGVIGLRVDYPLFVALEKLSRGLPRQLLPDKELNRLDAFLEQLRRLDIDRSREFFIHNHDERTTAQVTLSPDLQVYESVKRA